MGPSPNHTFLSQIKKKSKYINYLLCNFLPEAQGTIEICLDNKECLGCSSKGLCKLYDAAEKVMFSLSSKSFHRPYGEAWEECICQILKRVPMKQTMH